MKILLPFINKRIELSHLFVGILAVFGKTVTARESYIECAQPYGDYQDTCNNLQLHLYVSSDFRVPSLCKLEMDCHRVNSNLAPTHSELYFPSHIQWPLERVSNIDGILTSRESTYSDSASNEKTYYSSTLTHCQYADINCETTVKPYHSSDSELSKTDLCIAETSCTGRLKSETQDREGPQVTLTPLPLVTIYTDQQAKKGTSRVFSSLRFFQEALQCEGVESVYPKADRPCMP